MTMTIDDVRVAEGMATLTSRARDGMVNVRETLSLPFRDVEIREKANGTGGAALEFEGYACVTEAPFEMWDMFGPFTEIVRHGAFARTLGNNCDTGFLVNHEGIHLARTKSETLRLAEDDVGLHTLADLDPLSPHVLALRSALERKDMDEMSMAFRVVQQAWSPDYEQRDIIEINLDKGDVSTVNYGANPHTSGGLRSLHELRGREGEFLVGLAELRAGKKLSTATTEVLSSVLSLITGAGGDIDEARGSLDELLAVEAPDADAAAPPPEVLDDNPIGLPLSLARALAARAAV